MQKGRALGLRMAFRLVISRGNETFFPAIFSLYLIDFACIINKAQKYFAYSFL